MQIKNVLVTGGAGYIGSMVCKILKKANINPICFDNLSRGHLDLVKFGPFFKGDLKCIADIEKVFNQYQIDAVIHMASLAYVIESIENPNLYYQNNVVGSINLLSSMLKFNIKRIVFSSTCATYGNPNSIPIDEKHPQNPINPYGKTKYIIEKIIKDYSTRYNIKAAILRYFNAAGADFDLQVGEKHLPETHIIPNLIHAAMGLKKDLIIYGNTFPTNDKTAVRDYIHIEDLANAHLKALAFINSQNENISLNLGTGEGHSILKLIKTVEEITSSKISFKFSEKRKGEPPILIANNTRAKKILNFEPQFSDIKKIVASAYNWYQKSHF
jgi:UDP-glucose 4-epimerase